MPYDTSGGSGAPMYLTNPLTGAPAGGFDTYGNLKARFSTDLVAGADGASNSNMGVGIFSGNNTSITYLAIFGYVFNGASWDRQRGDTFGSDSVLAARPTAGGATQFRRIATADTNATVVKAAAGRVYGYTFSNLTGTALFVKLYNKATAPTVGTDVPLRTIYVPPNGVAAYHLGQGLAGFSSGIAIAATTGVADTDATAVAAGALILAVDYA